MSNLSGFCGLTVDSELKCLFEKFFLPKHKFYPIQVRHLNMELFYYWFHFVNSFLEFIDFESSTFELFRKSPFQILKEFKVSSIIELHNEEGKLNFEMDIRAKKIVLKQDFPNYDIISLRNITPLTLVSEKLKIELERSGLNGFIFGEYEPLITSKM